MGRIKSKLVKRTTLNILKERSDFSDNFEENKNLLKDAIIFKKTRNQIAGYLARIKKGKTNIRQDG